MSVRSEDIEEHIAKFSMAVASLSQAQLNLAVAQLTYDERDGLQEAIERAEDDDDPAEEEV